MKATSDYLNREPRALADVMQMRESSDLGIPSDSNYEGTQTQDNMAPMICVSKGRDCYGTEYPEGQTECDWCGNKTAPISHLARGLAEACDHMANHVHAKAYSPWTVPVQNYNPKPPLYQPSDYAGTVCEPGPTYYQQKMAARWRLFRKIAFSGFVLGAISLSLWAVVYPWGGQ